MATFSLAGTIPWIREIFSLPGACTPHGTETPEIKQAALFHLKIPFDPELFFSYEFSPQEMVQAESRDLILQCSSKQPQSPSSESPEIKQKSLLIFSKRREAFCLSWMESREC